jgi:hypothetical protein
VHDTPAERLCDRSRLTSSRNQAPGNGRKLGPRPTAQTALHLFRDHKRARMLQAGLALMRRVKSSLLTQPRVLHGNFQTKPNERNFPVSFRDRSSPVITNLANFGFRSLALWLRFGRRERQVPLDAAKNPNVQYVFSGEIGISGPGVNTTDEV